LRLAISGSVSSRGLLKGAENKYRVIIVTLNPSNQTQHRKNLRLDFECYIEIPRYIVSAEWDAGQGPEKHHRALQSFGVVAAVVDDYLGDELLLVRFKLRR
jgi:hypothetical protein